MSLLFLPEYREYLTDVKKWKIICSDLPSECTLKYDAEYTEWLKHNIGKHSQREAVFCLNGETTCCLGKQLYSYSPGTLLLFDVNQKHAQGYLPETNAIHMWMFFVQKRILVKLITISNGRMIYSKRKFFVDNPGLYNLLVQEWSGLKDSILDSDLKRKRLLAVFSLLFIELIELDMKESANSEDNEGNINIRQRKIIKLIEEHIHNTSGKNLTIEKLARIAGYSKFYFIRLFKQQTGYKVHDYINLCRMNRIAEMESSDYLQKEIAEELGFSCLSAYCHWRKQLKHKRNSQ